MNREHRWSTIQPLFSQHMRAPCSAQAHAICSKVRDPTVLSPVRMRHLCAHAPGGLQAGPEKEGASREASGPSAPEKDSDQASS